MFTASYPAELHAEENGKGFWVSFPDLGEELTGGASVADALEQAADCLAEAIAEGAACGRGAALSGSEVCFISFAR